MSDDIWLECRGKLETDSNADNSSKLEAIVQNSGQEIDNEVVPQTINIEQQIELNAIEMSEESDCRPTQVISSNLSPPQSEVKRMDDQNILNLIEGNCSLKTRENVLQFI